jgi:hypothetical protein
VGKQPGNTPHCSILLEQNEIKTPRFGRDDDVHQLKGISAGQWVDSAIVRRINRMRLTSVNSL